MSEPSPVITEQDMADLNQRALLRTVDLTRRAATALLVVAALLVLAWLWMALRSQGLLRDDLDAGGFFYVEEDGLSIKERIDVLTTFTTPLGYAALAGGLAMGLRLFCDAATWRAGASLTGWKVGDPIEPDDGEA